MRDKDFHREFDAIKSLLKEIKKILKECCKGKKEATELNLAIGTAVPEGSLQRFNLKGITAVANIVSQQVVGTKAPLTIAPADANGNPAPVDQTDHPVAWTSTDPAIVEITDVALDGLSCMAHFKAAGTASVSVDADADLDPAELRALIDTVDFTIVAAGIPEAATLGLVVGAAVPETP